MALQQTLSERSHSLARTLKTRLRANKAHEAAQLQPVALAGASNKFHGPSQLCSAFAPRRCVPAPASPPLAGDGEAPESDCQYVLLTGAPSSSDGELRACRMCAHVFLQAHASAQRYPDFCSLDCKSAFLLGANAYRDGGASEGGSTASPSSSDSSGPDCSVSVSSSSSSRGGGGGSRRHPRRQWV